MGDIVLIKNFPNRSFAEQAKEILARNNIGCVIKSVDPGILGSSSASMAQGVDLYVDEENQDIALKFIDALYDGI